MTTPETNPHPQPVRRYIVEHTDDRGRKTIVGRRSEHGVLYTLAGNTSQPYKRTGNVNKTHQRRARGKVANAEAVRRD